MQVSIQRMMSGLAADWEDLIPLYLLDNGLSGDQLFAAVWGGMVLNDIVRATNWSTMIRLHK